MNMNTRWVTVLALMLSAGTPGAFGQILSPLPEAGDAPKPTREWPGMLRVKDEKVWRATVSLKAALYAPRKEDGTSDPAAAVRGATFVLPWMQASATQRSEEASVEMRGWLGGAPMPARQLWLTSPQGMQRLRGLAVTSPGTSQFGFEQARKHPNDWVLLDPPTPSNPKEGMYAQLELRFAATARDVELNEALANSAEWPSVWPPEARSTFEAQVFLDLAVDPWSRRVHEIDQKAIASVAQDVLEWGGETDPKHLKPVALARVVAAAVLPGLVSRGDGMVPMTDVNGRNLRTTDSTGTGSGLPVIYGTTLGVDVRDVVSVLRDGYSNPAERALVLAAIYRKLGLPARVMVGFEADKDNDSQLAKRLGQIRDKKIPETLDGVKKKLSEADAARAEELTKRAPLVLEQCYHARRSAPQPAPERSSGGGALSEQQKKVEGPKNLLRNLSEPAVVNARPLTILRSDRGAYSSRKRMRFWVEFAVYDPEQGLAWIPVDPGSGGQDWHFGSVEGEERIVVLGTGFWPAGLEMVDRLGNPARPLQHLKRDWSESSGDVFDRPDGLPGAFWGFFTHPAQARVMWQEFGMSATRDSARASP